jgi:hypothetical protein
VDGNNLDGYRRDGKHFTRKYSCSRVVML